MPVLARLIHALRVLASPLAREAFKRLSALLYNRTNRIARIVTHQLKPEGFDGAS